MFKKLRLIPIMALALTLSHTSFAETAVNAEEKAPCPCMQDMQKWADALSLDTEQKNKIKALKTKNQEQMLKNRETLKSIRGQIDTLIQSDKIDETKLDALISQKTKIMDQAMKDRVLAKHEIFMMLSPQQKEKFLKMKTDKMQNHQCKMM